MDKQESWAESAGIRRAIHRYTVFGASVGELFDAYSRIKKEGDWYREFNTVARKFEEAADKAEDTFIKASNYMKAVLYYHVAQSRIKQDNEEKKQAYWDEVRTFGKAGKYLRPPLEPVEYPFMGMKFSGYLRKPANIAKPPCVITVRGVDATKEIQDHLFSEFLLERGLATLGIDCPGHAAPRFAGLNMRPDFEKPVGAALDYLQTRKDVDTDKIGIIGVSFGAYAALRAASLDKRLKACVSVGGWYDFAEFDRPANSMGDILNDTKLTAADWAVHKKEYNLVGIIERMTCPLLLVNGSEDPLAPVEQLRKVYEHAQCPKEIKIYQGYGHCAYNQDKGVIVSIADWLSATLTGKKQPTRSYLTFTG